MVSLVIRAAEAHDYAAISDLFAQGDNVHAASLPDRFQVGHPARSVMFFNDLLASTTHHLLIAELHQQPIGLIEFRVVPVPAQPPVAARTFVAIDSLIVDQVYQRRRIGHKLMQAVEHWATLHKILMVELNVFAFNAGARRLYAELGYTVLSQRMLKELSH